MPQFITNLYKGAKNFPYKKYCWGLNGVQVFGFGASGYIAALGPLSLVPFWPIEAAAIISLSAGGYKIRTTAVNIREFDADAEEIGTAKTNLNTKIQEVTSNANSDELGKIKKKIEDAFEDNEAEEEEEGEEKRKECNAPPTPDFPPVIFPNTPHPLVLDTSPDKTQAVDDQKENKQLGEEYDSLSPVYASTSNEDFNEAEANNKTEKPKNRRSSVKPDGLGLATLSRPSQSTGAMASPRRFSTIIDPDAQRRRDIANQFAQQQREERKAKDKAKKKKKTALAKSPETLAAEAQQDALKKELLKEANALLRFAGTTKHVKNKSSTLIALKQTILAETPAGAVSISVQEIKEGQERSPVTQDIINPITTEPNQTLVQEANLSLKEQKHLADGSKTEAKEEEITAEEATLWEMILEVWNTYRSEALWNSLLGLPGGFAMYRVITDIGPATSFIIYVPLAILTALAVGAFAGFFAGRGQMLKDKFKSDNRAVHGMIAQLDVLRENELVATKKALSDLVVKMEAAAAAASAKAKLASEKPNLSVQTAVAVHDLEGKITANTPRGSLNSLDIHQAVASEFGGQSSNPNSPEAIIPVSSSSPSSPPSKSPRGSMFKANEKNDQLQHATGKKNQIHPAPGGPAKNNPRRAGP